MRLPIRYIYKHAFLVDSFVSWTATLWVIPYHPSLTLCEVIPGRETNGLQFTISHKLDVQVPPTGADICWAFLPTEATNDGRETKRPIADLDVVKLTLPGRLDRILFIEEQVDALSRGGFYNVDTFPLRRVFLRIVRWGEKSSIRFLHPGPTLSSWCHTWVILHLSFCFGGWGTW